MKNKSDDSTLSKISPAIYSAFYRFHRQENINNNNLSLMVKSSNYDIYAGFRGFMTIDSDEDGFKNLLEYIKGTDPLDSELHPSKAMPWLQLLLGNK